MKNYFKSTIAIIFVSSLSLTSCLDLNPGATNAEASLRETVSQSMTAELPAVACDFDSRKTVEIMKEETAIVTRIANSPDSETPGYIFLNPTNSMRYTACNMPDNLKVDGMKVTFDAEKKEVYANERWYAHPIKLINIHNN